MATQTYASRGGVRWYPRWAPGALAGVVALCVLAVIAVEVVAPLSAGLPIGWGQYRNSQLHVRIGTPPFWNVVADNSLEQGMSGACALDLVASPNSEAARPSALAASLAPRWISLSVAAPCFTSMAHSTSDAQMWQPMGQMARVNGGSAPIERKLTNDALMTYRVDVALQHYHYTFLLQDPTAALAQQDMSTFLTFVQSFHQTT